MQSGCLTTNAMADLDITENNLSDLEIALRTDGCIAWQAVLLKYLFQVRLATQ